MRISPKGLAAVATAVPLGLLGAGTALAAPAPSASGYQATTVLSGPSLSHAFTTAAGQEGHEHLTLPDDITVLHGILYVGFQNGVGPRARPAPTATATARSWPSPAGASASASGTSAASATG